MKILQLHNRQLGRGGSDIQLEREADGLIRRGHTVRTMLVDNREIEVIGNARAAARSIWNGPAVHELQEHIRVLRPDVVHVHTPFPLMSPAVFVVAHRAGLPVVTTSHSFRYSCVKATMLRDGAVCEECVGRRVKLPAVVHRCYKDSLAGSITMASTLTIHRGLGTFTRCVDRYLALTPFMRERIIAEGVAPGKVVVKPNSAPDPGPPLPDRRGYALYAGRFVPEKGIGALLDAWSRYAGSLRLVICGDGELRPEVEAAAAGDPRITLHGWLDSSEVTELLAHAEVLLIPSEWYEGQPVIMIEAYATGTPVISSDIGNFTDYVEDGVTGARFRTGDADALLRTLQWFDHEADRAALRLGARASFDDRFEEERVLDDLEAIYREVIAERSTRPA